METSKKVSINEKAKPETAKLQKIEGGNFIKHVFKKGGKNNGQLVLEELDEKFLHRKLTSLTRELDDYKERCARYKKENLWYQQEIEVSQRDNAEYIAYLESKKDEKLEAIQKLYQGNKQDMERFNQKKETYRIEYQKKIAELQDCIAELEVKLNGKEDEFLQLSETMVKRSKHYEDINKIREEIKDAETKYEELVNELEKKLLDNRIQLQKDAEEKIKLMESAAEEKAQKYLAAHSEHISKENSNLEKQLYQMTLKTQRLISRRDQLISENTELERQQRIRDDLVAHRLKQIGLAELKEEKRKTKRRDAINQKRKVFVESLMMKDGLDPKNAMPDGWQDVSDDD